MYLGKFSLTDQQLQTLIQLLSQKALQFHTQVYWWSPVNEYEDDSFQTVSWKMPPLVDILLFQEC